MNDKPDSTENTNHNFNEDSGYDTESYDLSACCQAIKRMREELGWSLHGFSDAICISMRTILRFENGEFDETSYDANTIIYIYKMLDFYANNLPKRSMENYIYHQDSFFDYMSGITYIRGKYGNLASYAITIGFPLVEEKLDKIIDIMKGYPSGTHIGQIKNDLITNDFLPSQFIMCYDYNFFFRLRDRLERIKRGRTSSPINETKEEEEAAFAETWETKCAADEILYYWADIEVMDYLFRYHKDIYFKSIRSMAQNEWSRMPDEDKTELYENDIENYINENYDNHFPHRGTLSGSCSKGAWIVNHFFDDTYVDKDDAYHFMHWFDIVFYKNYYDKLFAEADTQS